MLRDPAKRRWGSYGALTGAAPAPPWLDTDAVHGHLPGSEVRTAAERRRAAKRYAVLVAAGKDVRLWDEALRGQIHPGDEKFVKRMPKLIRPAQRSATYIPRPQRRSRVRTVSQFFEAARDRDDAIVRAHLDGGHTLTAIAREAGLSVSRVSRIVSARLRAGAEETEA